MKTAEIESLILQLLTAQPEVSIRTIASAAGLSPDDETKRKAIQRALISLIEQGLLISRGKGRSHVYILSAAGKTKVTEREKKEDGDYFRGIPLSPESENLLISISKPIETRSPVGFDRTFLESYEPNVTFYLSAEQRGNFGFCK
jgi:hypothetical protein